VANQGDAYRARSAYGGFKRCFHNQSAATERPRGMRSFYLNGVRSSTKDPTSFFLYKEILAKMLAALIKGTEKREQ